MRLVALLNNPSSKYTMDNDCYRNVVDVVQNPRLDRPDQVGVIYTVMCDLECNAEVATICLRHEGVGEVLHISALFYNGWKVCATCFSNGDAIDCCSTCAVNQPACPECGKHDWIILVPETRLEHDICDGRDANGVDVNSN